MGDLPNSPYLDLHLRSLAEVAEQRHRKLVDVEVTYERALTDPASVSPYDRRKAQKAYVAARASFDIAYGAASHAEAAASKRAA
tara:strand:+ start:12862 stop:13113 length:252 start_codon:yes stop_codon:yes gene_type:complete